MHAGRSGSTTPLPHHCPTSHMGNKLAGKERVSPEAMELIQAMDRSLVTPARSESGFPGPLALPIDISSRLLTGGVQAVCAGASWLSILRIFEPLLGAATSSRIHITISHFLCILLLDTFLPETVAANQPCSLRARWDFSMLPGCAEAGYAWLVGYAWAQGSQLAIQLAIQLAMRAQGSQLAIQLAMRAQGSPCHCRLQPGRQACKGPAPPSQRPSDEPEEGAHLPRVSARP